MGHFHYQNHFYLLLMVVWPFLANRWSSQPYALSSGWTLPYPLRKIKGGGRTLLLLLLT